MRAVAEYLENAAAFNTRADRESHAVAQKRYIDLAESYRIGGPTTNDRGWRGKAGTSYRAKLSRP